MNHKHISLIVVAVLAFLFIEATLWVRGKKEASAKAEQKVASEESHARQLLAVETANLNRLQASSKDLIAFLDAWQPHFEVINTPQSAEVNFTMRIKDGNLVSLSQRYERASLKAGSSIPSSLRAVVTFEDNFAGLLNWLGRLEADLPTVRTTGVRLGKGTRPGDLRMDLTVEQPLLKQ